MVVRAKFKCVQKDAGVDGSHIGLDVVYSGSPENEQFFKWTPSGNIRIGVVNSAAAEQFVVGKEYYVDFTEATAEAAAP